MSEERKVMCRYCGEEMQVMSRGYADGMSGGAQAEIRLCWMQCKCGAESPKDLCIAGQEGDTAYLAATRTPPNKPMTREQVEEMPDLSAVWKISPHNGKVEIEFAGIIKSYFCDGALCFAFPPTPADIEAARNERVI